MFTKIIGHIGHLWWLWPKGPIRDFTNFNKIYKAHRTNVWWAIFWLHYITPLKEHFVAIDIDAFVPICQSMHRCLWYIIQLSLDGLGAGAIWLSCRIYASVGQVSIGILAIGPLGTKLQYNFNPNTKILIYKNAYENIVCEMAAILSRERWVKSTCFFWLSIICMICVDQMDDIPSHGWDLQKSSLIARFMGPTWGPPGANRTQVGPMMAPWSLLSGL